MQLARKGSGSFLAPASQSGCGECYAIWRLDGMSGPALSDHYARESDAFAVNTGEKQRSVSRMVGSSTVIIHRENTVTCLYAADFRPQGFDQLGLTGAAKREVTG